MSTPSGRTGNDKLIQQFIADGLTVMFGNPGTVEQGFLDAADHADGFDYVLALQETVAAGIADGYARVSGGAALLQLHTGVGLGNGIGMLYQSMRGHTPLVVVAGDAGVRYDAHDAQMAADLVAMARPVTKWATRVTDPGSLLRVMRRAVKTALTEPRGPVFVALPMDVLDAVAPEGVVPTSLPVTRSEPAAADVARAASLLAGASNPVMLVGDGVSRAGGQDRLVAVAEALGARVWGVDCSEVVFPASHPLWQGQSGHMFGTHSADLVRDADAVLIAGTYVFPEVFPALDSPFRPGAPVVHIDLNAYEIAKNFPVDLGLVADPALALGALAVQLRRQQPAAARQAAAARLAAAAEQRSSERAAFAARDHQADARSAFLHALATRTGGDLIVFDEALTSSPALTSYLPPDVPGDYHSTRGGSLGIGIPGAIGAKLARPDRTVVGFTGDGGSMYTIQALWTAARHGVAAKFVICNNGKYRLLDDNIDQYWRERGITAHNYPCEFDLSSPAIDFAGLANALGVQGTRVDKPQDAAAAVDAMLAHPGPYLVDLRID